MAVPCVAARRAPGIAPDDAQATRRRKLDGLLSRPSTPSEDGALFAELLSIPSDGPRAMLDLTPQERRSRTIQAVVHLLEVQAHRAPVIAVFEDAHWIDPTTLDVLSRLVASVARLHVLIVVTFRPEFAPPWAGAPHVTLLTLNRLAPPQCRDLVEAIVRDRPANHDLIDEIVARSDGVPLYVEELTKAVLRQARARTQATPARRPRRGRCRRRCTPR
jgi:predicted ATPase